MVVAASDPTVEDPLTEGERVGYVLGAVLVPVVTAVVVRFLWVRLGRGKPPVMAWPWILLIGGILGLTAAVGLTVKERQERIEQEINRHGPLLHAETPAPEVISQAPLGQREADRARAAATASSSRSSPQKT